MRWLLIFFSTILFGSESSSIIYTQHELIQEKGSIPYLAITGQLPLNPEEQEGSAPEMFFVAYFKKGELDRPITFVFPGGPGGACGPEAICTFGPRRLLTLDEGKTLLPPYTFIDNPETLLPWTDLVFVDPVGTGFSTLGDNEEQISNLLSVDGDIEALGDFVRTFVAYFNRWNSPKYLSGSSYGTTRCCGLAEYLTFHDFSLNGIILLGAVIDFSTQISQQNRFLPDSLILPTFAATAWYHGRFCPDKSLKEVVDFARDFALRCYAPMMMNPSRFTPSEQKALYEALSQLIGLPFDTVRRYQGRFDEDLYTTEFFGPERKVLGGLDTRYVGDLSSTVRIPYQDDPSYREVQGLFCAFNHYLENELETSRPFHPYVSSASLLSSWDFSTYDSLDLPDLIQRVRRTLIYNPQMKIFIGSGYYDCRTPFATTEYSFEHLDLPENYKKNIQFEYYEAGHGFIFDYNSLKKLSSDLIDFYEK